jgi:hypothetical protein
VPSFSQTTKDGRSESRGGDFHILPHMRHTTHLGLQTSEYSRSQVSPSPVRSRAAMARVKRHMIDSEQITRRPRSRARRSTQAIPQTSTPPYLQAPHARDVSRHGLVPGLSLVPYRIPLTFAPIGQVDLPVWGTTASYRRNSFIFQYFHAPGAAFRALPRY